MFAHQSIAHELLQPVVDKKKVVEANTFVTSNLGIKIADLDDSIRKKIGEHEASAAPTVIDAESSNGAEAASSAIAAPTGTKRKLKLLKKAPGA